MSFGRIGITSFENNVHEMDMFRHYQRQLRELHDSSAVKREHAPVFAQHAHRFQKRYVLPTAEDLLHDKSRSSMQYHARNVEHSRKTHTVTTTHRPNAFLRLVQGISGAPTSDSTSPYPYKNTQFERKHGDEIGSIASPPAPNAEPIVFTVEPVSGVPHTVQVKIQSPRNEPLILKYGRADGHHHPMSREITNEAYLDGIPEGEYVFIIGYPTVSAGVHDINLNDPFTRLDFSSMRPVDHSIVKTAPGAKRIHKVGTHVKRV